MRVIAGRLGGRIFQSPGGHRTHPMSDKMRGALFNMLGDMTGLRVLDAFAGSGALGFEAASRGAQTVLLLERERLAQRAIAANITDLDVADTVKLVNANAASWLQTSDQMFDVVLLDPPYDNLQISLLEKLSQRTGPDGVVAISWPGKQPLPEFDGLDLLTDKHYGDGSLALFRRASAASA